MYVKRALQWFSTVAVEVVAVFVMKSYLRRENAGGFRFDVSALPSGIQAAQRKRLLHNTP
jgi:hypothetical protein